MEKEKERKRWKERLEGDYRGGCRVVSQWFQLNEPPGSGLTAVPISRKDTGSASGLIRLREGVEEGGVGVSARPRSRVNLTCWE